MAAPKFKFVQGTTSWASGTVTEFSTTSGAGNNLGSITGAINLSSNSGATGPQSSNTWSATYPVVINTNSYEFIWGLYVTSVSDNNIANMKVWVPAFTAIAGCTFYAGTALASAFASPVNTASTKATTNFTSITTQGTGLSVGNISNVVGALSNPVWVQVQTTGSAVGGNQTGMPTVAVSVDWS